MIVTLDQALASGRVFIEDYKHFEVIPVHDDAIAYAAMCLHYVKDDKSFIPIAIQLEQRSSESSFGVFYPDEGEAWLFAKVATQSSYSLHHQVVTHLLKTHLNIEVWTIALHRNILPDHPIFILLQNHLQKTIAINDMAREILLPSIIDYLASPGLEGSRIAAKLAYDEYNFTGDFLKNDLVARGVWDPTLPLDQQVLHGYDYRDFTLPLWDALEELTEGIVHIFYKNDKDVEEDISLQLFAQDITIGGKMKGFPSPIRTREELVGAVTMMMFTTSVQHAAVNYNQYDYFGYIPSSPLSLNRDAIPKSKCSITRDTIFNVLPTLGKSAAQSATVWALSRPPFFKEEMLDHPMQWSLPVAQAVVDRFVDRLQVIEEWMKHENQGRIPEDQYTVLYPTNIPKATQI